METPYSELAAGPGSATATFLNEWFGIFTPVNSYAVFGAVPAPRAEPHVI
jgi:hypothetical protein